MSPKGVHAKTAAALAALTLSFTGVVLTPGVTATESGQDFTSQAVANGGDGKFPVYRIPSIVQLNNGDLVVSYDGRPSLRDAPNPNSILQRRSTDGGRTWGEQTVIHAGVPGAQKQGCMTRKRTFCSTSTSTLRMRVSSSPLTLTTTPPATL